MLSAADDAVVHAKQRPMVVDSEGNYIIRFVCDI